MTRNLGAVAFGSVAISLVFPSAVQAFAIHSFAPADVTLGTRLVIKGDFAELAAAGAPPKVVGTRMDTPRTVKFQVLALSRRTIIAKVRAVPSTKADRAAGKSWSLRVRSPGEAGTTAQADETFTTAGPALLGLESFEARPGEPLALFALDPGVGKKPPTVLVGGKKAKVLGVAPAGRSPDDDPWRVRFRAPGLRNGFYPVRLENTLGRSARLADLLIFGGASDGLAAFTSAAVESQPAFEAPFCSVSSGGGGLRVSACESADCGRVLELGFAPDPAGGYRPAELRFRGEAASWIAARASARLVPPPAPELVAGTFVAELEPEGSPSGQRLRMRGYFQAPIPR